MKRISKSIIFCLVLALFIQNTCPFGAAGKSSVVPKCGHCPLVRQFAKAPPAGQTAWAPDTTSTRFPLFLFTAVKLNHTFQLEALTRVTPLLALDYAEVYPAELLKPPHA